MRWMIHVQGEAPEGNCWIKEADEGGRDIRAVAVNETEQQRRSRHGRRPRHGSYRGPALLVWRSQMPKAPEVGDPRGPGARSPRYTMVTELRGGPLNWNMEKGKNDPLEYDSEAGRIPLILCVKEEWSVL